jgi:transcriptional regulator with XRE-family HTH domain
VTTEFARWLSEQSRARSWRQKDLASAVGVSQQTASRWLLGRSVPTVRSARALANALGVPTDEVVGRLAPERAEPAGADEELAALRRRVAQLEAQLEARQGS